MSYVENQKLLLFIVILGIALVLSTNTFSQKVAILTPQKNAQARKFAENFGSSLAKHLNIVDLSLAESVLEVKDLADPYNLTVEQSKNLGVSIGCNFFIVIKTNNQRRSSFARKEYYESYATLYLVSSKSGRLVYWKHQTFEEDTIPLAKTKLFSSISDLAFELRQKITYSINAEINEVEAKAVSYTHLTLPTTPYV